MWSDLLKNSQCCLIGTCDDGNALHRKPWRQNNRCKAAAEPGSRAWSWGTKRQGSLKAFVHQKPQAHRGPRWPVAESEGELSGLSLRVEKGVVCRGGVFVCLHQMKSPDFIQVFFGMHTDTQLGVWLKRFAEAVMRFDAIMSRMSERSHGTF